MRTTPLSGRLAEKIVTFESIVREAERDGRIDQTEAIRIVAAGRAMGRDAGALADAADFCGTVLHGTAGLGSHQVVRKINRIRRKNVIDLYPELDDAA